MNCPEGVVLPEGLEGCMEVWNPGIAPDEDVPEVAIEPLPPVSLAEVQVDVWQGKKVEQPLVVHQKSLGSCRRDRG